MILRSLAISALLLIPFSAMASEPLPDWSKHPKTAPSLQLAVDMAVQKGTLPEIIPVIAELIRPLDTELISALSKAGARTVSGSKGPLHIGPYLGLRIPQSAMGKVLAMDELVQMDAPAPIFPKPLNIADDMFTANEMMTDRLGSETMGNLLTAENTLLRGIGTTGAVVDFNLDPYHPALFHADAGVYEWIDSDGNGVFDAAKDGIDLNGDGELAPSERLQLAEFPVVVLTGQGVVHNSDGTFTPYLDYLFLDENGDGQRNYGSAINAQSDTPGLSEPTFVGDDLNNNGKLDPNERLFRLGTPKIKLIYDLVTGKVFSPTPGINSFNAYLDGIKSGKNEDDIEFHGTYECTRVAGGHAEVQHLGGIAPGADLVFIDIADMSQGFPQGDLVSGLAWLRDYNASAYNYAFGQVVSQYADGSAVLEGTIAELHAEGAPQSASSGNEGDSDTHAIFNLKARDTYVLPIKVGRWGYSPNAFYLTLRWRGGAELLITQVGTPGGTAIQSPSGSVTADGNGLYFGSFGGRSPRNTGMLGLAVNGEGGEDLAKGTWQIEFYNDTNVDADIDVWVNVAGGYPLASITDDDIFNNRQTVTYPATADNILTVGACSAIYSGQGPSDCARASYSSNGPRIDGQQQIALVAPTEMLAGYPLLKYTGGYLAFGGTSGASPHVTGVALLLFQREPDLTGLAPSQRIIDGLNTFIGNGAQTPNIYWGFGILDAWETVFPGAPRFDRVEGAQLVVTGDDFVEAGYEATLKAEVTGYPADRTEANFMLRADVGYDGEYEVGPIPGTEISFVAPDEAMEIPVKVQAVDNLGNIWGAVVWVTVGAPGEVDPGEEKPTDIVGGEGEGEGEGNETSLINVKKPGSSDGSGCAVSPKHTPPLAAPAAFLLLLLLLCTRRFRAQSP